MSKTLKGDHTAPAAPRPAREADALLPLKMGVLKLAGRSRRAVARALRALPGSWGVLGLPRARVRSLKDWVGESRASLGWMERGKGPAYEVFHGPQVIHRRRPVELQGRGAAHAFTVERSHIHDEIFLARLPGARVLGPSGVVLTPDGGAVEESIWSYGFLERDRLYSEWRLPRPERLEGIYYTIATPSSEGFWHWMLEALPRLFALDGLPHDEIKIIVSKELNSWQRESLELLGLDGMTFVPLGRRHLHPEVLYFPAYVGTPGNPHRWGCEWLRRRLGITAGARDRRFYITRRAAARRRVVNEEELEPILAARGFEIIEGERLSLREKARLLARAEVVAGPHGAGLTNILFAPPGCKVFELFDPNHMMVNYYAAADVLDQPYYYLIGEAVGRADPRHAATGHDDIRVPAELFARSLDRVLGA